MCEQRVSVVQASRHDRLSEPVGDAGASDRHRRPDSQRLTTPRMVVESDPFRNSRAINRPVEEDPFAVDLRIGLVDTPRRTGRLCGPAPAAPEVGRMTVHPEHDRGLGHRRPRSAIISTTFRTLSLKRRYHRPHATIISRSRCRPSNGSSKPRNPAVAPPSSLPTARWTDEQAHCTRSLSMTRESGAMTDEACNSGTCRIVMSIATHTMFHGRGHFSSGCRSQALPPPARSAGTP